MIYRPINDIRISNNIIFIAFKSGDTELFLWNEQGSEKEFFKLNCDKSDEHEDELQSLDYLPHIKRDSEDQIITGYTGGLFVTGGKDGLIKVWNIRKELIREIKFPEPITSVCFLNSLGDILVGHVGKVSSVLAKDYKPYEVLENAWPTDEETQKFLFDRSVASDKTFEKLKKIDDDVRRQYTDVIRKSPKKQNPN